MNFPHCVIFRCPSPVWMIGNRRFLHTFTRVSHQYQIGSLFRGVIRSRLREACIRLSRRWPVAEIFGSIADLMRTGLQNGWEECRYTKICPARWNTTKIRYVFSNSTTMLRLMRSVLLCLPVVLITSCATITRGSHDKLTVL